MKLRIKILPSNHNEWLGWFGDEVIKVKLQTANFKSSDEALITFLNKDLGINRKDIKVEKVEGNFVTLELPEVAWELFLTVVE